MPKPKLFEYFSTKEVETSVGVLNITNLSRRPEISPDVLAKRYSFYDYIIGQGERPDHVAHSQYGNSKYYWVILVINNIRDVWYDWPMDAKTFDKYIISEYGSKSQASSLVYRYVDNDTGLVIDEQTKNSMPADNYTTISMLEREDEINEEKRRIKLVQARYVAQLQSELEELYE